jgi:hypothetical protein
MSTRRDLVRTGPHTHRAKGSTDARRSAERSQAYELRLRGRTLRQIADDMGCSTGKVQDLLREEIKLREDPLIDKVRQLELDRLDGYMQACMYVLDNPGSLEMVMHWDGTYELNDKGEPFKKITMLPVVIVDDRKILGAIDRLVKISESRRKLLGVDAPIKTHVEVTETTQQDLEIQELIREAQARAAAGAAKINNQGGVS